MHIDRYRKSLIFYSLIILSLFCSVIYSNGFIEKIWTVKSLFFSSVVLFILILTTIIVFFIPSEKSSKIYYNLPSALFSSFCLYVFFRSLFQQIPVSFNHDLHELIVFFIFYHLILFLIDTKSNNYLIFSSIILMFGFIQIIWVALQLLGISSNLISNFEIAGGLGNPNVLSTFLSSIIIFAFNIALIYKSSNTVKSNVLTILSWIFIVSSVILIIFIKSRSAWIGLVVGMLFFIFHRYNLKVFVRKLFKNTFRIVSTATIIIVLVSFASIKLYELKSDSALGRVFIWKNTADIILDHIMFGVGYGGFSPNYIDYQANYFKEVKADVHDSYFYLADDIHMAYNEFLQIWAETGVFGFILFLLFIYSLFRFNYVEFKNPLLLTTVSALIVLLVNSLFSYTLQVLPIYILFIIYSAIITADSNKSAIHVKPVVKNIFLITILILSIVGLNHINKRYQDERDLKLAVDLLKKGEKQKALSTVENSNGQLISSKYYILIYGKLLNINGEHKKAIQFLERSREINFNYYHYMLLGESYSKVGDHENAIKNFRQASYIIPHLITPRFKVVKEYEQNGEISKAIYLAKETIELKEKVSSEEVDKLKKHLKQLIDYHNSNSFN